MHSSQDFSLGGREGKGWVGAFLLVGPYGREEIRQLCPNTCLGRNARRLMPWEQCPCIQGWIRITMGKNLLLEFGLGLIRRTPFQGLVKVA